MIESMTKKEFLALVAQHKDEMTSTYHECDHGYDEYDRIVHWGIACNNLCFGSPEDEHGIIVLEQQFSYSGRREKPSEWDIDTGETAYVIQFDIIDEDGEVMSDCDLSHELGFLFDQDAIRGCFPEDEIVDLRRENETVNAEKFTAQNDYGANIVFLGEVKATAQSGDGALATLHKATTGQYIAELYIAREPCKAQVFDTADEALAWFAEQPEIYDWMIEDHLKSGAL